jgi:hypothetical protein
MGLQSKNPTLFISCILSQQPGNVGVIAVTNESELGYIIHYT